MPNVFPAILLLTTLGCGDSTVSTKPASVDTGDEDTDTDETGEVCEPSEEVCDGVDNDCDGITDNVDDIPVWFPDDDGDGFSDTAEIAYGSDPRNPASVANQAPTVLDLNNSTITENQPSGTIVGKLTGIDPDGNATLAFSRANGQGSKHNN